MEKAIKEKPRKPYTKPRLRQVDLRPEEAVLGGCKTSGAAGPAPTCDFGGGCSTISS